MDADAIIELVHRVVGYPLAFIVGPLALATFAGAPGHKWTGRTYALTMTFLYVTGTLLTLTRHEWGTWEFGRNVVFNLLGYSFVLHGWRAMWLQRRRDVARYAPLDVALLASMALLVAAMTWLAIARPNTPVRVFAAMGIAVLVLEAREWRAGLTQAQLYRRHVRYMLASYFYVLTVVSLVHLRDEMASDLRWLWPSAFAVALIWLVDERARATRWTMRAVIVLSLVFGAYVAWELVRDNGQVERMLGAADGALDGGHVVQVQAGDVVAADARGMPHQRAHQREPVAPVARGEAPVHHPERQRLH